MSLELHNIEVVDGSAYNHQDRIVKGALFNLANNSSAGAISSVTVTNAGSGYTSLPTLGTTGNGSGATLNPVMKALAATLQTAQSGSGSYAPSDTITLTGGTFTTASVMTVVTTQVVSATVAAAGTGGTNGTQTVTGTTGTGTKFQASVTVSSGGISAVNSISLAGSYTVNPTTLTAEPVTGAGLSGAQLNIKMGVLTFNITTAGAYSVLPTNPVAQGSTSGSGTGATFNITSWGLNSVTVAAGGTAYDNTSALTVTGGGGSGAAGTLNLNNAGNAVTVPIAFASDANFPVDANGVGQYGVVVNPGQDCRWYVAKSSKTGTGFNVVLTPKDGSTAIAAGNIDVFVEG